MPRATKAELVDQLLEVNVTLDEIAAILANEDMTEGEKVQALEDLLFDADEEDVEEVGS